jgi:hypothetical protein
MLILAIDLSTKPGIAVLEDGKLVHASTCFNDKTVEDFGPYPMNYVKFTQYTIERFIEYIQAKGFVLNHFDNIVIEETTASKQNYSQKKLEFLHHELLLTLNNLSDKIVYIRDGTWKKTNEVIRSKEEKAINYKIKKLKQKTGKRIIRRDEEGNALRKVSRHDVYIRRCNDIFGTNFGRKEEDAAAACLLGLAFCKRAPICDGTVTGGLIKKG